MAGEGWDRDDFDDYGEDDWQDDPAGLFAPSPEVGVADTLQRRAWLRFADEVSK